MKKGATEKRPNEDIDGITDRRNQRKIKIYVL